MNNNLHNLTGIFNINKGSVPPTQQNEQYNSTNYPQYNPNESYNYNTNTQKTQEQKNPAPIGFEAFGSPNDSDINTIDSENTNMNPHRGFSHFESSSNSNFPSFGSGFASNSGFSDSFFNNDNNNRRFPDISGAGFNDPFFSSINNDPFFNNSGFNRPTMPSNDSNNSRYPEYNPERPSYPSYKPDRPAPPPPRPSHPSGNDSNSNYPSYKPDRPVEPTKHDNPKPNKYAAYAGYGKKLLDAFNNQIIPKFSENIEKNKDKDGISASINKDPKKYRQSYHHLVKATHTENFIPSQDYNKIRQRHSMGNRFVDEHFKATNSSVSYTSRFKNQILNRNRYNYGRSDQIIWKRAKDLINDAHFVCDESGRYYDSSRINEQNYKKYFNTTDLDQGALGNCWFISGACGIIQNYDLFGRVVPFDNTLEDNGYTGAFHFRFWLFGEWKEVVIDDFLPVDSNDRLIFSKNHDHKSEFWAALLEKAYAKVCGSYEALDGGLTTDALIDMSGGIDEEYDLKKVRKTMHTSKRYGKCDNVDFGCFWEILVNARKKQSVIGANIAQLSTDSANEMQTPNGLVRGHAYIITKLAEIEVKGDLHKIMRIYNPWGNDVEWKGEWSDKSSIWRQIDNEVKELLELKIENDGEFWMSYKDWVQNFDMCQICNLTPNLQHDISESDWENSRVLSTLFSMWQCQLFHGKWTRGISAGGCGQPRREMFWTNPQFTFIINECDLDSNNSCYVIIGLMQKHTRKKRTELKVDSAEAYIQYRLFKLKDTQIFIDNIKSHQQIESHDLERVDSSGPYINKREVTARFSLKQGAYVIIPTTYEEGEEGEFLLRIFTEKPLSENNCIKMSPEIKVRASNVTGAAPGMGGKSGLGNDMKNLINDVKGLSFGAGKTLGGFVNIASDLAKVDVNTGKEKNNCSQM